MLIPDSISPEKSQQARLWRFNVTHGRFHYQTFVSIVDWLGFLTFFVLLVIVFHGLPKYRSLGIGGRVCFMFVYVLHWMLLGGPPIGRIALFILLVKCFCSPKPIKKLLLTSVGLPHSCGYNICHWPNCMPRSSIPYHAEKLIIQALNLTLRGSVGSSLGLVCQVNYSIRFGSTLLNVLYFGCYTLQWMPF